MDNLILAGMLEGEEVDRRLKKATTSVSGTAVMKDGKAISSRAGNVKRLFGLDKLDKLRD